MNQWGAVALGVVCVILGINMVGQYRAMQPGKSRLVLAAGNAATPRSDKISPHVADDLAKYDPVVHFDTLKALDSRPLPDEERNPFQFVGQAPSPLAQAPNAPASAAPPPPPPPPPLPLKAVGYNELPGGKKEAMVTYNDDLEVVHEGDMIGTKFKVVSINPTMVVVEDGETHKTIQLPFESQ
jgi:hypothetical protein